MCVCVCVGGGGGGGGLKSVPPVGAFSPAHHWKSGVVYINLKEG